MILLRSKEEFESHHPYDKKYLKRSDYPTKYPVIMCIEDVDGGLGGPFKKVHLTYPHPYEIKSFMAGMEAGMKVVDG